jgi:SAM-dependent methyltransferase
MDAVSILVERIRSRGVGASEEINPFWRRLVKPLEALVESGATLSPQLLHKTLGYGARRLPKGVASNRDMPGWSALMHAVDSLELDHLGKAVEHVAILHFLKGQDLLDAYVAQIDRYRLVSNLNLGRLYWYAAKLDRILATTRGRSPGQFLEIGPGSGFFAILMADLGWVRHYVMVDLPEMLLNAVLNVRAYWPQAAIRLGETPDFSSPVQTCWLLETGEVRKVASGTVDVALNFNSFMEMDDAVRDFYIEEIYRTAALGALFYNVNRRQAAMTRKDGGAFDNNPLLYPYHASDRVLEWAPDECQESCRAAQFFSGYPSFTISRVAEISA